MKNLKILDGRNEDTLFKDQLLLVRVYPCFHLQYLAGISRTFNMVPGVEAIPIIAYFPISEQQMELVLKVD